MSEDETELAMVQRHVREGVTIVARQRELLDRLRAAERPIEEAEILLASFEDLQRQHEEHLAKLTNHPVT